MLQMFKLYASDLIKPSLLGCRLSVERVKLFECDADCKKGARLEGMVSLQAAAQ